MRTVVQYVTQLRIVAVSITSNRVGYANTVEQSEV